VAGFVIFLVVLAVVGVAGWLIITKFNLGQTALVIFGLILLLALVLYLFGALPWAPPAVVVR
jgi:hypothetical protein